MPLQGWLANRGDRPKTDPGYESDITKQLLRAVVHLHDLGMVHRGKEPQLIYRVHTVTVCLNRIKAERKKHNTARPHIMRRSTKRIRSWVYVPSRSSGYYMVRVWACCVCVVKSTQLSGLMVLVPQSVVHVKRVLRTRIKDMLSPNFSYACPFRNEHICTIDYTRYQARQYVRWRWGCILVACVCMITIFSVL